MSEGAGWAQVGQKEAQGGNFWHYNSLKEGAARWQSGSSPRQQVNRRGNSLQLLQGRFRLDFEKKKFFMEMCVKHWNMLSREAVESISEGIWKKCSCNNWKPSLVLELTVPGKELDLKGLFQPSSMIQCAKVFCLLVVCFLFFFFFLLCVWFGFVLFPFAGWRHREVEGRLVWFGLVSLQHSKYWIFWSVRQEHPKMAKPEVFFSKEYLKKISKSTVQCLLA